MNEGLSVTISGGKGSDVIVNNCDASLNPYDDEDGSNVLIRYAVGDGEDAFIYTSGEGKDVICDFDDDDMLQILGTFSANPATFNPVEILDGIFYR